MRSRDYLWLSMLSMSLGLVGGGVAYHVGGSASQARAVPYSPRFGNARMRAEIGEARDDLDEVRARVNTMRAELDQVRADFARIAADFRERRRAAAGPEAPARPFAKARTARVD